LRGRSNSHRRRPTMSRDASADRGVRNAAPVATFLWTGPQSARVDRPVPSLPACPLVPARFTLPPEDTTTLLAARYCSLLKCTSVLVFYLAC
jgi:hypothetical protein